MIKSCDGWHGRHVGLAPIHIHTEPQQPFQCAPSVHVSELRSREQAIVAEVARSTDTPQQQSCRCASLTPLATSMQQPVCSRPSAFRASRHAGQMQVSAVRQRQHACMSTTAMLALGASSQPAVHPPGHPSIPPSRRTSAARSQQREGVFRPDKVSRTLRAKDSKASTVSASVVRMREFH